LGKADATVRQEVRRLDSADCAFHQSTEFLALLVSDGSVQVLNLDSRLRTNTTGRPSQFHSSRVADELGIHYASLAGNAGNEEKLAAGLQPADGLLPLCTLMMAGIRDIVVICTCCNFCAKGCFNTKGSGT